MSTARVVRGLASVSLAVFLTTFSAPWAAAAPALVSIEAVTVGPASPGPGVICTLGVRIKNAGSHSATDFRFKVRIDGEDVTVYHNQTYAVNVAPGTSDGIALYNFWSPAVHKASFAVEVAIVEARWADVKQEGSTSTTTPVGPIEGLPVSATQTVHMSAK
jgi:hypothetical protein